VQKKKPDDICVYYNIDGEITNSDKLVFPNHLCRSVYQSIVVSEYSTSSQ